MKFKVLGEKMQYKTPREVVVSVPDEEPIFQWYSIIDPHYYSDFVNIVVDGSWNTEPAATARSAIWGTIWQLNLRPTQFRLTYCCDTNTTVSVLDVHEDTIASMLVPASALMETPNIVTFGITCTDADLLDFRFICENMMIILDIELYSDIPIVHPIVVPPSI